MTDVLRAEQPVASFAALLRRLRAEARLTQEELAERAGLSPRSISDLERGVSRTARKETARLLADALAITGPKRTAFVAAARGRAPVSDVLAASEDLPAEAPHSVMLWCSPDDLLFALQDAQLRRLIDAMTATVSAGRAMAGIWLIGLTTATPGETASPRPGASGDDAARSGGPGRPGTHQLAGRRLPALAGQLAQRFGPAAEPTLGEVLAAALNNEPVALGAALPT